MLPSKGYLKLLDCPYFSLGICDRPHCHFKHKKKDKEAVDFLPESEEKFASAQITNSSYGVTQEHILFWDNLGLNFGVQHQLLTTNVSYEFTPITQSQKHTSSSISETRTVLNTSMESVGIQHNIGGVLNKSSKHTMLETAMKPTANDLISDYLNLEYLNSSLIETTDTTNSYYFQKQFTDISLPVKNTDTINKKSFLESLESEENTNLIQKKNQSRWSDMIGNFKEKEDRAMLNTVGPTDDCDLINNVLKKREKVLMEFSGSRDDLIDFNNDFAKVKERKSSKNVVNEPRSKNCYKSLTMKYRKNERSHVGKPYPTKNNFENDKKRICKIRSKGIKMVQKKNISNRPRITLLSPLSNKKSVNIDFVDKIISEKVKQSGQILRPNQYLERKKCMSSISVSNKEHMLEKRLTNKLNLELDQKTLTNEKSDNLQFKDDSSKDLVDNRVKTHTKTRVSLGMQWLIPTKKRVDTLTPAERILMLAKKRSKENNENNRISVNDKPLRIRSVPNVELLLREKERLLRGNTDNNFEYNNNDSNSFVGNEQLHENKDEAPRITKKVPHPQKAGADSETRQKCLEMLYSVERQLVRPGRPYRDAREKCLQAESKIWMETTHKTYLKKIRCLIDIRKSKISFFTLKYYNLIKTRRTATFLQECPMIERVQSGKFNLNKNSKENSEGLSLYSALLNYRLSDIQLETEGYPIRKDDSKGNIQLASISESSVNRWHTVNLTPPLGMYMCINCKKFYSVDENGLSIDPYGCSYHAKSSWFGKKTKKRYNCCGGRIYNPCMISKYHSTEIRDLQNMEGFVETKEPRGHEPEEGWGVFALDCEMYWSTQGQELGRVTVVNAENRIVYDTFVKPENYVTDYCTKISGLTEENLSSAPVSFTDVQKAMLKLFNSKTILIGHSLERDLKVLKLIHKNIVDTAIVFQTQQKKASLKLLATNYLKEIIQSEKNCHDSVEDAITCLRLMKQKIMEDNALSYKISQKKL